MRFPGNTSPVSIRGVLVPACLFLAVAAGCGSKSPSSRASLTAADVKAAFGDEGIRLTPFSGGQLVSASPPTVEVEVLESEARAKAASAPQEVNGVEVKPVGTRNILVWVDSKAPTDFQQHVSAALSALSTK
jgi:hypothetical protein